MDGGISTSHLPKLDCQYDKRIGQMCNRGFYKSAIEKTPQVSRKRGNALTFSGFPNPVNFVCAECLYASLLGGVIYSVTSGIRFVKTAQKTIWP